MFVKIVGFAPDLDPATPGILLDCDQLIPTIKGMKAMPSELDAGIADLSATAQGVAYLTLLNGTSRTFAGTATKLYEISTNTWADRSRTADYAIGPENVWDFAQFNNVTLAAGNEEPLQFSDSSGNFGDLSGAPECRLVEVVGDFVMLFDTNDSPTSASYGDNPDRWWCSAIGDYTNWTPSIATQCATDRLIETPGPIIGARKLGDYIVAYKEHSMYLGVYVGPPFVWNFQTVPVEIGAMSNRAIISVDSFHVFISQEDFFMFDGTRPISIAENSIREWFFNNINYDYTYLIQGVHDRKNFLAVWYFPSASGGGVIDSFVAYNYRSQRWGYGKKSIQAALEYATGSTTYDGLGSVYSTYDDIPTNILYDSAFLPDPTVHSIIDTSGRLKTLNGSPANSSLLTGDFGQDNQITLITRIRPRFQKAPTTGIQEHRWKTDSCQCEVTSGSSTLTRGAFDLSYAARWHRFRQDYTGNMELTGFDIEIQPDSYE